MNEELTECPVCGKLKPDVEIRNNPFLEEVYDEIEELESCQDCWQCCKDDV